MGLEEQEVKGVEERKWMNSYYAEKVCSVGEELSF